MRIARIMCSRKRKGISTILGTLIFIGILFTSVIPMMLVMKQADTMYTQKVKEMEYEDQDRDNEDIKVYAYPVTVDSNDIKVRVENSGAEPARVVRVWFNDEPLSQDVTVSSLETVILGPFTISVQNGDSFSVEVATERGNIYASSAGDMHFLNGLWFTPSLGIVVSISNFVGKYRIWIANSTSSPLLSYETQGIDWGDVIHTIMVDAPDTYQITIEKKIGVNWVDLPATPVNAVINWPNGSPIVNVLADGSGV